MAECRAAGRASLLCDATEPALSTPQSPQDERDLGAIDEIFDVPHARLASTPKPGSPGANASGVPRLLRLRYRALTPAAGTPPGRRTTLTGCWLAMRRRGHRHHFGAAGRGALDGAMDCLQQLVYVKWLEDDAVSFGHLGFG